MGIYSGFHEVGHSVVEFLKSKGTPTATHYGPAPETPTSTTESVRVTLLWITPQPTHRNDAAHRNSAGALQPAPITLSAYVMISTYGGGNDDPATAYDLLSRVIRIFHETPVLTLPIDGVGEGRLNVTLVPTAADLMEKVFSPLQLKHRPFAIYEIAPIQVRPLVPADVGKPPVKPGGVAFGVTPRPRPLIVRVTPERQVPGGAIRIDHDLGGAPLGVVTIGGVQVPTTPIPGIDAVRAIVPPTTPGDAAAIALRANPPSGLWSEHAVLGLLPATAASLDAPTIASVSVTAPALTLVGRGLGAPTRALVWPDAGAPGDGDVRELAFSATTPTSVTILGTELDAKLSPTATQRSLLGMPLRLVVRLLSGSFTPYIRLEVTP